jgi:chromosome segregation ATPase
VVSELSRKHTLLRAETEALRGQLEVRDSRIGELEGELSDARSRRESALERLDTLIAELDRLDGRFESGLEGGAWGAATDATGLNQSGAVSKQAGV